MRGVFVGLFTSLASLSLASSAVAQEAAERPFSIRPSFQIRGVVTDNIALTDRKTDDDIGVVPVAGLSGDARSPSFPPRRSTR